MTFTPLLSPPALLWITGLCKPFPGFMVSWLPSKFSQVEALVGVERGGDPGGDPIIWYRSSPIVTLYLKSSHLTFSVFRTVSLVGAGWLGGSGDSTSSIHSSRPTTHGACCPLLLISQFFCDLPLALSAPWHRCHTLNSLFGGFCLGFWCSDYTWLNTPTLYPASLVPSMGREEGFRHDDVS